MKGLICYDIDGTLTHRLDHIDPKIETMLSRLSKEGWTIALITGRSFGFAQMTLLPHLTFSYYLAVQNGSDLLQMPGQQKIHRCHLSARILPIIEKGFQGIGESYIIYSGMDSGDFCYYRKERFSKKGLEYLKKLATTSQTPWQESDFSFEKETHFPLIKGFGTEKEMRLVQERLSKESGIEVSCIRDPIDPSYYLALITHSHANKGEVLRFLKNRLGAPIAIAAGDQENDRSMLEAADISIAIETAPEDLCANADILAKPPSDLGIIEATKEAIRIATL